MMRNFVVITAGRFGTAVAESLLGRIVDARVVTLAECRADFDEIVREATFVGAALWRPYQAACDALDAACARHGTPWSGAMLDGAALVTGPLIVPGAGPCYACYWKRRLTHAPRRERQAVIDAAFGADDNLGLSGFVPGSSALAAAALLLDMNQTSTAAGRLRRVDLLRGNVEETRVVRVHGCFRCSQVTRGERYVARMVPELKSILS
jgi:bacteriocin biosynthesis cyclodehydratase domain-containing protein